MKLKPTFVEVLEYYDEPVYGKFVSKGDVGTVFDLADGYCYVQRESSQYVTESDLSALLEQGILVMVHRSNLRLLKPDDENDRALIAAYLMFEEGL